MNCNFPANPGASVTAAVVRDTMKWTFCMCCVLVREEIFVCHQLQSVPVVELAVKRKPFRPCPTFRLTVYKKLLKNLRGRLDLMMMEAAVAFLTLLHVYQTTRRHIPGTFNVMLHNFEWFKGILIKIDVLSKGIVRVKRWLYAGEKRERERERD